MGFYSPYGSDSTLWTWIDGTSGSFSDWETGDPDSNGQACARFVRGRNYKWRDNLCTNEFPYICEGKPCFITVAM